MALREYLKVVSEHKIHTDEYVVIDSFEIFHLNLFDDINHYDYKFTSKNRI